MIVVTGATGQLGRRIVKQLLERVDASQVGASTRSVEQARDLMAAGVRVRRADYNDEETLRIAFEGASQVLLVSSNTGPDPIAHHRAAIHAAQAAGVRRIVYTSQISSSPTSAFIPGVTHATTERLLRESGLRYTALRNGFYATTALTALETAMKSGELVVPTDGKFSWTGHDDLAEAAAVVLTNEGRFEGATPPLTGPEALDHGDLARLASQRSGKEVRRITVDDEEFVTRMVKAGQPEFRAKFALGMFIAARRGEFAEVNPTLHELIGRKPATVSQLLGA